MRFVLQGKVRRFSEWGDAQVEVMKTEVGTMTESAPGGY